MSPLSQAFPSWEAANRGDRRDCTRIVRLRLVNCSIGARGERLKFYEDKCPRGGQQPHNISPKLSKAGGTVTARRTLVSTISRISSDAGS